jgi:hypothetical protein
MEKRQYTRIESTVIVRSKIFIGDEIINGVVDNLSINGLLFKTPQPCPLNQELDLVIFPSEINSNVRLETKGKAVRQGKKGIGIQFNKPEHDLFENFIKIALLNICDEL